MILSNSEVPDYLKPIYQLYFNEKNKDSFIDICEKWTFEDMVITFQALSDYDMIMQVCMEESNGK